ncbi:MAG: 4Fe-4S cluster-binding domain-containing protein [Clostridia bacterium]|nr:4Fe-4S cluster-binding domain-containing protein [Clostridia bacterium]
MMKCNICPRECGADREKSMGCCGVGKNFTLARAAKHMWEEPPISGTRGSGTVFFSGCNLGCVFCQNYEISHGCKGKTVSAERLREICLSLINEGVHNINFVNPTHYALELTDFLELNSFSVPVVYNCGGYEKTETLRGLEDKIQIYLPDLKYISDERSGKYASAPDYFSYASQALVEMKRQCPENIYDGDGIMQRGMIVRHLILPKNTNQSLKILDWIKENLGTDTVISLMSQYTPYGKVEAFPELQRKITEREYLKVLYYAENLGFENIFTQSPLSADEEFIPDFDFTGV